jgi:CMP-N,N'-diacetyllegionaminic acid synthase
MTAEVLALIPARGGSKSIPLKNLLMVAGKPLIAHTIEQALNSRRITRTIVSTDHEEIAAVAREFGAEVPFMRPTEFALDLSPDIDVFRHAVEWLRDHQGYEPELIVHLRPTGPVRRVELIDQAIETMLSAAAVDSLRSVNRAVQTPYKMWSVDQGILRPLLQLEGTTEPYNLPRQQLPQVYWQNGYVDIVRPRTVLRGLMSGGSILPFIVDEPMLEIDYEGDVAKVEEALLKLRETGQIEPDADPGRHSV